MTLRCGSAQAKCRVCAPSLGSVSATGSQPKGCHSSWVSRRGWSMRMFPEATLRTGKMDAVDLPVMPPVSPMLAKLVSEIPPPESAPEGMLYEPKWDGFRCIVFRDGDEVELGSRNERPLTRYFPEVVDAVKANLPQKCVVDGELIVVLGDRLDFDSLQLRLHPAESRVRKLAGEIPASFVAFDLLLWKGKPVHERPIEKRRAELEKVGEGFELSPVSDDVEQGREWLRTL